MGSDISLDDTHSKDRAGTQDGIGNVIPEAGDRAGTSEFVLAHISWMMRTARQYLTDKALAEDAVQNAFTKVFTKGDQFQGEGNIKAWMRRIVVNEALMILRKRKSFNEDKAIDLVTPEFDRNGCRFEPSWSKSHCPEQVLITSQTRQLVMEAVAKLPETYRIVLLLRDIEEHSTSEVAQMLDISETNVKVRLHRARAALKVILEPGMRDGRFGQ
ncbi:MAG: sigma-70 family RNA polymerase sigma factor [Paracoccaceae bacterium]